MKGFEGVTISSGSNALCQAAADAALDVALRAYLIPPHSSGIKSQVIY